MHVVSAVCVLKTKSSAKNDERRAQAIHTSQVTRDVIPFGANDAAIFPSTGKTEVVCRLSSDMEDAEMLVKVFRRGGDTARNSLIRNRSAKGKPF